MQDRCHSLQVDETCTREKVGDVKTEGPDHLLLLSHLKAPTAVGQSDTKGSLSLSCVQPFATPQTAARQDSLSITISRSLFKLMSIESVMASNHLAHCCPLLLLPSVFPSIRVFSDESLC